MDSKSTANPHTAGLQPSSTWSNRSVLELGAGLGLVGLYLGKLQADVRTILLDTAPENVTELLVHTIDLQAVLCRLF